METGNLKFVRHIYEASKVLKSYTVYQLTEIYGNENQLLTDVIRIEPFRHYSKGQGFKDYLRIKNKSSWAKSSAITGLRFTASKVMFFGDCDKPYLIGCTTKSLLLFYLDEVNPTRLVIDVFKDYYTNNGHELQTLLKGFKTV